MVSLVLPEVNTEWMSLFLAEVARRYAHTFLLLVLDGAGWHRAKDLLVPAHMRLTSWPARSPELNPAEHRWEEIREKGLGNQLFLHQQAVEHPIEKGLAALGEDPQRVASLAGFHWIQKIPLTTV
ncbi:MAG: transposase [Acidobacteriaceae bacterium]|nr:transposase [Acidobacteriaceae bacterium]